MIPQLSLGIYDGALTQPSFDWDRHMAELNGTRVNRVSVHAFGEFLNNGFYPLNADLSLNEKYFEHYERMVDSCSKYNIGIEVCLFSQYIDDGKNHPLKGKLTAEQLYTNHFGADWKNKNSFKWLWYESDPQDNVTKWDASSHIGESLVGYVQRLASIHAKYRAIRPVRTKVWVRAFNETSVHTGEDNRVNDWARQVFWDAGFPKGISPQFAPILNPTGTISTAELNASFKWSRAHGYLFEIHSIDDHMDIVGDKSKMIASTDGVKDDIVSDVIKQSGVKGFTNRDAKFSEAWCGGHFKPDMNVNFETALPDIQKLGI